MFSIVQVPATGGWYRGEAVGVDRSGRGLRRRPVLVRVQRGVRVVLDDVDRVNQHGADLGRQGLDHLGDRAVVVVGGRLGHREDDRARTGGDATAQDAVGVVVLLDPQTGEGVARDQGDRDTGLLVLAVLGPHDLRGGGDLAGALRAQLGQQRLATLVGHVAVAVGVGRTQGQGQRDAVAVAQRGVHGVDEVERVLEPLGLGEDVGDLQAVGGETRHDLVGPTAAAELDEADLDTALVGLVGLGHRGSSHEPRVFARPTWVCDPHILANDTCHVYKCQHLLANLQKISYRKYFNEPPRSLLKSPHVRYYKVTMTEAEQTKILSMTPNEALQTAGSCEDGITSKEAAQRLSQYGLNTIRSKQASIIKLFWRQIGGNPLVIILALATVVSYLTGEHTSAYYIFGVILLSAGLGFWNEFAAERTVRDLLKRVALTAIVSRDNKKQEVPVHDLTIGDIVFLSPGSIVPADMRLLSAESLELDQSALTGESKTVYKTANALTHTPQGLSDYANIAFMSTNVTSGFGKGVIIAIGKSTEFGKIAHAASFIKPETDFQKGLRKFGELIAKVIGILTVAIFSINFLFGHPLVDSLLFSLAIAVGLTPELLPIIVTVSLSHGAGKLAKKHVVSKQLIAIENLGNMDILCTDKTGTLTEGHIVVTKTFDTAGNERPELIRAGITCNTAIHHHKIVGNAIDVALWEKAHADNIALDSSAKKVFEEPFDYEQRAMFCVIEKDGKQTLIAKGAPDAIFARCNKEHVAAAHKKAQDLNAEGLRLIAIATKPIESKKEYTWKDLAGATYEGMVAFMDVPKKNVAESIRKMENLGAELKIVTGDNELVTEHICKEVGIPIKRIIRGDELMKLSAEQQQAAVLESTVFARVTPSQKLRIIELLRKAGHTVGYMGDGVNDIPALKSADVGISVNTAVDVAKDAASVVLLRKGLDVIADGIIEGRRTFSNTIKYILMDTSSNFGNMFSAAGASFFLPFLPMSPTQILLNNTLYDISQISIPTDNVDEESLRKPRHWDIKSIKYYMLFFGPISSIYDFLTFGVMLWVFHANQPMFQTGWFVESLATQILVVFIIRTSRRPFFKSRPSKWLITTSLGVVGTGLLLPFTPLAHGLGFVPLPPLYFLCLLVLVGTYLLLVAWMRGKFLRKYSV